MDDKGKEEEVEVAAGVVNRINYSADEEEVILADDDRAILESNDGGRYVLPVEALKISATLTDLHEQVGSSTPIPVVQVDTPTMKKAVDFMIQYMGRPIPTEEESAEKEPDTFTGSKKDPEMDDWDKEFINTDVDTRINMIMAANYLDIKKMLEISAWSIAQEIKGKTPEEIRKAFNIKNDFSPEEEEQIRREHEWVTE